MAVQTVCAQLRAHLVRSGKPAAGVTGTRNKGGDSSKDEAARAACANAKACKVPGAEGRLLGATPE